MESKYNSRLNGRSTIHRVTFSAFSDRMEAANERRHCMDPIKTGEWIAARRKEKELTQKDLAARLGVTDKAVSRWETGDSLR